MPVQWSSLVKSSYEIVWFKEPQLWYRRTLNDSIHVGRGRRSMDETHEQEWLRNFDTRPTTNIWKEL
jgi:hypothetical protein